MDDTEYLKDHLRGNAHVRPEDVVRAKRIRFGRYFIYAVTMNSGRIAFIDLSDQHTVLVADELNIEKLIEGLKALILEAKLVN